MNAVNRLACVTASWFPSPPIAGSAISIAAAAVTTDASPKQPMWFASVVNACTTCRLIDMQSKCNAIAGASSLGDP